MPESHNVSTELRTEQELRGLKKRVPETKLDLSNPFLLPHAQALVKLASWRELEFCPDGSC